MRDTEAHHGGARKGMDNSSNVVDNGVQSKNKKSRKGAAKRGSNMPSVEEETTDEKKGDSMKNLQLLEHIDNVGDMELKEWIMAVNQSDGLATLRVTSLQKILIRIGRSSRGSKGELISEVQDYVEGHQTEGKAQDKGPLILQTNVYKDIREIQQLGQDPMLNDVLLVENSGQEQSQVTTFECQGLSKKICHEALTGEMVESKVDTLNKEERVYTRRSQRNVAGKQILITEQHCSQSKVHCLGDDSKVSMTRAEELSLAGSNNDREAAIPETVAPSRKRRLVVKGPCPPEPKMIVASKIQEAEVLFEKEDPWTVLVHKKVQPEWSAYNPATMRPGPLEKSVCSVKLLSWNVNGLRALLKEKNQVHGSPILHLAQREDFDVLCLQETKLQEKDVLTIKESILPGYDNSFWSCSSAKLGYSGTAVISRIKPLSVAYGLGISKHDNEGRLITIEFDTFYLVTGYVPNSGQRLERLVYRTQEWDPSLSDFLKDLEKTKPVVMTGDLNCAHQEMDIFNPDGNRRSAGFTDEERASFEVNFLKRGMVDTFRRQHPHAVAYTYWGYRTAARPINRGWRLDYFLASHAISEHVHDSYTLPDVGGSDHCPIGIILRL